MVAEERPVTEHTESIALDAVHPIYTVDLAQRIVSGNAGAIAQFAPRQSLIARRCYEVLQEVSPANAALCHPDCPVITRARHDQPAPDFDIWSPVELGGTPTRMRVSILLQRTGVGSETQVVHLVRPVEDRPVPTDGAPRPGPRRLPAQLREPRACGEDQPTVTPRQLATLRLLADGYWPDKIAATLGVRPVTVRNHIQAAMDRLGARTRLEAVLIAGQAGLLAAAPGDEAD